LGGEPAGMRNRVTWGLAVVLAVVVLGGVGVLAVRLRPYLIARYSGRDAILIEAALPGASLSGVDLRGANLIGANLRGSHLNGSQLQNAWLAGADLNHANLQGADLGGAILFGGQTLRVLGARLIRTDPLVVKVKRTDLRGADLRGTNLQGARLNTQGARFSGALLIGAIYDAHTRWPKGFDPLKHGAIPEK
jgi:uncharacterized protein YjbI with pentapeptide repeats